MWGTIGQSPLLGIVRCPFEIRLALGPRSAEPTEKGHHGNLNELPYWKKS